MPPTDQAVALNKELEQQLSEAEQAVTQLYESAVTQFNGVARVKGVSLPVG